MSFEYLHNGQNELVLHVDRDPSSKVCSSVSNDLLYAVELSVVLFELLTCRISIINGLCSSV